MKLASGGCQPAVSGDIRYSVRKLTRSRCNKRKDLSRRLRKQGTVETGDCGNRGLTSPARRQVVAIVKVSAVGR
jgi:hypothetical protein